MAITQSQFSQQVAETLSKKGQEVSRKEIDSFLDAVSDTLKAQLKKKENKSEKTGVAAVPVRGIGRFKVRSTKPKPKRKGRNPSTGEEITIKAKPAGKRASVTLNKEFKQGVGVK